MVGSGGDPSHFEKVRDVTRFTKIIGDLEEATALSDEKKKELEGEARLLRGLMMYYLLHIYGPVPVIVDPSLVGNDEAEQNMERPTLQQMTEWITADFEYAVANMSNSQPHGRYTADFARYCLMRHCLNEGSYMSGYYDKVIQMCDELKSSDTVYLEGGSVHMRAVQTSSQFNVVKAVSTSKEGDGSGSNGNFNPISWYVIHMMLPNMPIGNTIPTPCLSRWRLGTCFNMLLPL